MAASTNDNTPWDLIVATFTNDRSHVFVNSPPSMTRLTKKAGKLELQNGSRLEQKGKLRAQDQSHLNFAHFIEFTIDVNKQGIRFRDVSPVFSYIFSI